MHLYVISPRAERDIESILLWTHEEFGEKARIRYEALLVQAMLDVAKSPERVGSQDRPEIAASARTYHIRHSRDRVGNFMGKIKRPRHFLLYRLLADGAIEIGRLLHDGMDLKRHLPDEYREKRGESGTSD